MRNQRGVALFSLIFFFSWLSTVREALSLSLHRQRRRHTANNNINNEAPSATMTNHRRSLLLKFFATAFVSSSVLLPSAQSFVSVDPTAGSSSAAATASAAADPATTTKNSAVVAYKSLSLSMNDVLLGVDEAVEVPIACWFPAGDERQQGPTAAESAVRYKHRISVRRIGQLLAGWNLPGFVARNFELEPSLMSSAAASALSPSALVVNGQDLDLPKRSWPVVLLAHGYLGSRFDLSHLAEELAAMGFVCLAPEYPESLAASYERIEGLDRKKITDKLLETLEGEWDVQPSSYGVVGHSLGCGTAIETGDDESWTRVCVAGFPRTRDGRSLPGKKLLFVASMNDGAVSLSKYGGKSAVPSDLPILEDIIRGSPPPAMLPNRAAIVLDGPNAPNHVSFLASGVGNAMVDFLSPLLPVAQTFNIPVLDFDRYKQSQDSRETARLVHPVVIQYLKQHMVLQS